MEKHNLYYYRHREKILLKMRDRRKAKLGREIRVLVKKKEFILKHGEEAYKRFCLDRFKKNNQDRKMKVFEHYGGRPPKCACCGEKTVQFLSIDHINGGGNRHRKEIGVGKSMYPWIVRNGFPEGFQILCFNCNMAKGFFGSCPHLKAK